MIFSKTPGLPPRTAAYFKMIGDIAKSPANPELQLISLEKTTFGTKRQKTALQARVVKAHQGLGHCIDDRQQVTCKSGMSPSGIAGGAVGIQSVFMLLGQNLREARLSTKALYSKMSWGPIAYHTDEKDRAKLGGCGYAQNLPTIAHQVTDCLDDGFLTPHPAIYGQDIGKHAIVQLKRLSSCREVVLKGEHNPAASLVINFKKGTTLDRSSLPTRAGAFVWDAHVICTEEVVDRVNSLTGKSISLDEWTRLHVVTTLATFGILKTLGKQPVTMPIILSDL